MFYITCGIAGIEGVQGAEEADDCAIFSGL